MQLNFEQLIIPPGHQLLIKAISWSMYERILNTLGEHRGTRIHYSQGWLEIMTPLPEHEDDKVIISNLIEIILEELDIEFRNLGSTTFKNKAMAQGLEPDICFYIQNEVAIRGKKRIDLTTEPPPDLAVEIDITGHTKLTHYEVFGIPELWRFDGKRLEIYLLQANQQYQLVEQSHHLPQLPIAEAIPHYLEQRKQIGRNKTMKAFRDWVKIQLTRRT
jgi:Uma2 family endonuclease